MARTTPRAAGAASSADGISSIVVERDRPGVSFGPRDRVTAARALPTCELRLDGVWVPADHLLGREGDGLRAALATIDLARAQVGAIATGLAQGALDEAVAYARERRAFGRAIAEFQGLQFLLADLAAQVEAARWLAYRAAWLFDQGRPATRACAIAKRVGVDAAEEVARKALEVFGGRRTAPRPAGRALPALGQGHRLHRRHTAGAAARHRARSPAPTLSGSGTRPSSWRS